MATAGETADNALNSAELYDVGLGFNDAWRPTLTYASGGVLLNGPLFASGSNFEGVSEAAGGNGTQNSATNYPLLQVRRLDNEQTAFILPDPLSNTSRNSYQSLPVTGFGRGYALATVFTNGIPSASRVFLLTELADVPATSPYFYFISRIFARGITAGCGGGNYCPAANITRGQMAAFIIRALHEPGYTPPAPPS